MVSIFVRNLILVTNIGIEGRLMISDDKNLILGDDSLCHQHRCIQLKNIYLFVGVVAKISFNNVCYNENLVGG